MQQDEKDPTATVAETGAKPPAGDHIARERAKYGMDPDLINAPYESGLSLRTFIGALFVAVVMIPASIYLDLVAGSGLDYVEAFTPAPDTDMTLAEALAAWPDKVLWINFPSSLHVASLEVIRKTTREFIDLARQTNRVIIGITEDIPEDRWQQNLLAISEEINRR